MCTGEHSPSPLEWACVFLKVALLLLSHKTVINCVSESLVTLSNLTSQLDSLQRQTGSTYPGAPARTQSLVESRNMLPVGGMIECEWAIEVIVLKLLRYTGSPCLSMTLCPAQCRAQLPWIKKG